MVHRSKKVLLTNTFGMFGYLFCLLLWMWVIVLYLPALLENEGIKNVLFPAEQAAPIEAAPMAPSPGLVILGTVITFIIMAVTIVVLLRAPITIARSGKAITTKAADSLEPIVTRGRPLPPKKKRQLTLKIIKLIKLFMVLLPTMAGLLSIFVTLPLPYELVVIICSVLAIASLFWFSAQYIIAEKLKIQPENLV